MVVFGEKSCSKVRLKVFWLKERATWNKSSLKTLRDDGSARWKQQSMRQVVFKGYSAMKDRRWSVSDSVTGCQRSKSRRKQLGEVALDSSFECSSVSLRFARKIMTEGGVVTRRCTISFHCEGIETSSWLQVVKATQSSVNSEAREKDIPVPLTLCKIIKKNYSEKVPGEELASFVSHGAGELNSIKI